MSTIDYLSQLAGKDPGPIIEAGQKVKLAVLTALGAVESDDHSSTAFDAPETPDVPMVVQDIDKFQVVVDLFHALLLLIGVSADSSLIKGDLDHIVQATSAILNAIKPSSPAVSRIADNSDSSTIPVTDSASKPTVSKPQTSTNRPTRNNKGASAILLTAPEAFPHPGVEPKRKPLTFLRSTTSRHTGKRNHPHPTKPKKLHLENTSFTLPSSTFEFSGSPNLKLAGHNGIPALPARPASRPHITPVDLFNLKRENMGFAASLTTVPPPTRWPPRPATTTTSLLQHHLFVDIHFPPAPQQQGHLFPLLAPPPSTASGRETPSKPRTRVDAPTRRVQTAAADAGMPVLYEEGSVGPAVRFPIIELRTKGAKGRKRDEAAPAAVGAHGTLYLSTHGDRRWRFTALPDIMKDAAGVGE